MNQVISWTKEDGVATLTIDHPPVNSISEGVVTGLNQAIDELSADRDVRVVIVTGSGDHYFVAGGHIKDFPKWIGKGVESGKERAHWIQAPFNKLASLAKPTIAAINGVALGGGCELALCCDMRIAEEHAILGLPEIKLGLFPGAGGTQRLPRLIGDGKAKELIFTGKTLSAAEAEIIGLVNEVVPKGNSLEKAKALAFEIANHSFPSITRIKKAMQEGLETTLEEGLQIEASYFSEVFQTNDVKIGVEAFLLKKKPTFKHH
jgi:enoyl-CoA hydratase/carnithine racemase